MTFVKILVLLVLITACSMIANAQVPISAAPAKVGIINSATFANPTGGITRLVNALRTIETEFKPRRDEITQLLARFNTLQQVPANTPPAQVAARREQAETLQIEIQRKQEDARVAYGKRLAALTDPIRANVFTALETYIKGRGIDVLIDISKFPDGILLANANADLTPGFIRDFNSKNP
ncbi:MAG TPA: OmpH family outer membrane protein [Pyrinomonadaceae bacterium]|nr:OmpH family outer membrane protein [Pyrinomonadaceae bacterium]